ncbi:hypothetical protein EDC96DRAFT_549869 [Choanephora cucurbitarum]|nr:hypothetical protein EDC96DRAFT_549869 [Choanephora cucurbitarum]
MEFVLRTITSRNTLITVDNNTGLCANLTLRSIDIGYEITIRSYDAGIMMMLKLKEGDIITGPGKPGHYAKLSHRNKPYVCLVYTLETLSNLQGAEIKKKETLSNHVLFMVYKKRFEQEDRFKKKSLAERLEEKNPKYKEMTLAEELIVAGAKLPSSSSFAVPPPSPKQQE